ncbi:MAG TPA: iron-containing alcohol dehydrogenase [Spirochaetota bacterium]|nr:iron-containing alcohol dehydrogenase [Spirochaetota bacterium]HOD16967.1 iron-containing alcohol dehydrogenase [Spirochaetota bacterium]HPG52725.1 iron-containing alcohol dehydrogenase [Spirochaetota bacterium]HPN14400.1 iron-containing alcohol dehydrogenase [Spirochaetota bacterium]
MVQYNYPTTILLGQGSLAEFVNRLKAANHKKILIVTDAMVEKLGIVKKLTDLLGPAGISYAVFTDVHPNPVEEDVEKGVAAYKAGNCDCIIGLGGGSPIDVAKMIKVMVSNPPPLAQYDDSLGGDRLITKPMPPLYAISTTSGTGSEVGRSGVIIMRDTKRKTIFFHPQLLPAIAVLEPGLTAGMPPWLTAATGMDALVHCLEAYFVNMFHPMADGIALQGIELVAKWLPEAYRDGNNLEAREKMQIAASMGAVAFQKGLGMVHSMAHPLSSMYGLHHGLANALCLPESILFIEKSRLTPEQMGKVQKVRAIFAECGFGRGSLSESCRAFCEAVGIQLGLAKNKVPADGLAALSAEAQKDPCHASNMIPVTQDDFMKVLKAAL